MLTLLKVETKGLTVPAFVPKKDIREGQWAIALGRALDAKMEKTPSISRGVVDALANLGQGDSDRCQDFPRQLRWADRGHPGAHPGNLDPRVAARR